MELGQAFEYLFKSAVSVATQEALKYNVLSGILYGWMLPVLVERLDIMSLEEIIRWFFRRQKILSFLICGFVGRVMREEAADGSSL